MVSVREVEAAEFFGDVFRFKTYAFERCEDAGWSLLRQSSPRSWSFLGRDPDFHMPRPVRIAPNQGWPVGCRVSAFIEANSVGLSYRQ